MSSHTWWIEIHLVAETITVICSWFHTRFTDGGHIHFIVDYKLATVTDMNCDETVHRVVR